MVLRQVLPEDRARLAELERRLGPAAEAVRLLVRLAAAQGSTLWAVGGAVRDVLDPLGQQRALRDIDITVVGDAVALGQAACAEAGGELVTSPNFGTASWQTPSGSCIDLASARREVYAHPGALPSVSFVDDIAVDLQRRDFAINALAVGLGEVNQALLLDPCGGLHDLARRTLSVLHERSFIDDPTRLWRAARLCARLQLTLAPATQALLDGALQAQAQQTLSPARLGSELQLCCAEGAAAAAFSLLEQWGCLAPLGLGSRSSAWIAQMASLQALLAEPPAWLAPKPDRSAAGVLLAALWADQGSTLLLAAQATGLSGGPAHTLQFKERLAQIDTAAQLQDNAAVAQLMHSLSSTHKAVAWTYLVSAPSRTALLHWADRGRLVVTEVCAQDLVACGVVPGPLIGLGLAAARRSAHAGHDRSQQLEAALTAAQQAR